MPAYKIFDSMRESSWKIGPRFPISKSKCIQVKSELMSLIDRAKESEREEERQKKKKEKEEEEAEEKKHILEKPDRCHSI